MGPRTQKSAANDERLTPTLSAFALGGKSEH